MMRAKIKPNQNTEKATSKALTKPQHMRIIIKNVAGATIRPSSKPDLVHIEIDGIDPEDLLIHVDITSAIQYFGASELLDMIGEETLRSYLKTL